MDVSVRGKGHLGEATLGRGKCGMPSVFRRRGGKREVKGGNSTNEWLGPEASTARDGILPSAWYTGMLISNLHGHPISKRFSKSVSIPKEGDPWPRPKGIPLNCNVSPTSLLPSTSRSVGTTKHESAELGERGAHLGPVFIEAYVLEVAYGSRRPNLKVAFLICIISLLFQVDASMQKGHIRDHSHIT